MFTRKLFTRICDTFVILAMTAIVGLGIYGALIEKNPDDNRKAEIAARDNAQAVLNSAVVVTREGCEYYALRTAQDTIFLHKGNCKNPIHNYRDITRVK